jgi:hypothetical protein
MVKFWDRIRNALGLSPSGLTPSQEAVATAFVADVLVGAAAVRVAAGSQVESAAQELEAAGLASEAMRLRTEFRRLTESRDPGKANGALDGPPPTPALSAPPLADPAEPTAAPKPRRGRPRLNNGQP